MKSALFVLITLLLMLSNFSSANTKDDQKIQAKALMDGVYESFTKVIPYVYSDEDSMSVLQKDAKKKEELIGHLTDLSNFFKSAKHVEYFQKPGFRPSLDSMNSHLIDTINAVNGNNYAFAQKRLSALTSLCISCHTQISSKGAQNAFGDALTKSKRDLFDSDYAYGNYLYLVRDFNEAEKYLIMSLDKSIKESRYSDIDTALRRIISVHTKVLFNYEKAINFVERSLSDSKMPKTSKAMLQGWKNSLLPWKSFSANSSKSIEEFIKINLTSLENTSEQIGMGDSDITLLISSGVLSKHLSDNPKTKNAPEILYWLSIAERRLSKNYFFSLSDLYLKDCVKLYSKSPFAKKCYNLYEENIEFGYTGSSGTDIPPEEKRELVRLKEYLK